MRKIVLVLVIVAAIVGGWWYASPIWTLREMRAAAKQHDAARLSAYVDYRALRENLKGELRRYINLQVAPELGGGGPLAEKLVGIVVGPVVDATVNADGVAAMFAGQRLAGNSRAAAGSSRRSALVSAPDHPIIERQGLSSFRVRGKNQSKGALIFHRFGLGWKLVGVELPADVRVSTG